MTKPPDRLLLDHLNLLNNRDQSLPVLDLACGTGRNGLAVARSGRPVVFADRSESALNIISKKLHEGALPGRTWHIDLEQPGINPFSDQAYLAVIVFRYLYRPLFAYLKDAVIPGGMVIYETFTVKNRCFGRPNSTDFLLLPGELETIFQDWEIVHSFEGVLSNPDRAIAQIVARKPDAPV